MTLRLLSALALLIPLAGAAQAQDEAASPGATPPPAPEAAAAATPAAAPADDNADSTEPATAPPAPALAPVQAYRPLNFYTREELLAFPAASVPKIAPFCHGAYLAPPLPPLADEEAGTSPSTWIAADRMQLDENGESQVAGSVEVRQGLNMMRADRAVVSSARDHLLLDGNVYLQDPAMTLEAARADLTLDGSGSHMLDTHYALHESHVRGSAKTIDRRNQYSVEIVGGAYTTCEPGHAAWMLAAHRIRIDQEAGWGSASHVRLSVEHVPVLYVPYITFPTDKRRRTGVLYPTFTFSSDSGTDIAVPYYLNLAPQYDLLLTPRWIEERGKLLEGDFRYLHGAPAASWGDGSLGVGWIAHDASYQDRERHVARFRHSGEPADGWQLFADATEVSDNDYLDDLGTKLSVNRDAHLLRIAQVRHTTDDWMALARVQAYQTIDSTIAPLDLPYRRSPQLLASTRQPLIGGIEWGALGEYTYFDRRIDTAGNPVGSRFRIEPALRRAFDSDSFRIEPALKLRHAQYTLDDNPTGQTLERTVPTAALDSELYLERGFRFRGGDWTQTLEPRAYALWTPYENQDDIPLFDTTDLTFGYDQLFRDNRFAGGDRIGDAKQVSLALESRFLAPDGSEAGRIGIGQAVYGADRRVQMHATDPAETGNFSPFVANVLWRLGQGLNARAEGQWSPEKRDFVRGSLRVNWQDEQFRSVNVAYRYDKPGIDQTELSGMLPVEANWNLVGRWIFDFPTARSVEAFGGFEYESCCWRARILARHRLDLNTDSATLTPQDSVVFEVELKGLGSLGDKISAELEETIPGYGNYRKSLP